MYECRYVGICISVYVRMCVYVCMYVCIMYFLCFVDRAPLYNLLNKAKFVQNLFSVYSSISTYFGRLCAHHQEEKLS